MSMPVAAAVAVLSLPHHSFPPCRVFFCPWLMRMPHPEPSFAHTVCACTPHVPPPPPPPCGAVTYIGYRCSAATGEGAAASSGGGLPPAAASIVTTLSRSGSGLAPVASRGEPSQTASTSAAPSAGATSSGSVPSGGHMETDKPVCGMGVCTEGCLGVLGGGGACVRGCACA